MHVVCHSRQISLRDPICCCCCCCWRRRRRRVLSQNQMLLFYYYHPLKLTSFQLPEPDLLGFGLFLMKKQYAFVIVSCHSRLHLHSDLGCFKDIYCREKDLLFQQLV